MLPWKKSAGNAIKIGAVIIFNEFGFSLRGDIVSTNDPYMNMNISVPIYPKSYISMVVSPLKRVDCSPNDSALISFNVGKLDVSTKNPANLDGI